MHIFSNELDLSKNTFKEAIEKKHYHQKPMLDQHLMDVYGDTLLSKISSDTD
jgi:hypothetical protein